MTIIRKNNAPAHSPTNWLDDLWKGDFFNFPERAFERKVNVPAVNIKETDAGFDVLVAAPGLKKEDFNVSVENNLLTISTEKSTETEETTEEGKWRRKEFSFTSFKRSFTLPDTINSDKIKALYEDGVLTLTLPKKEEAKKKPAKTIKIG